MILRVSCPHSSEARLHKSVVIQYVIVETLIPTMQRKDEILAKKAKLAELRRQREEREQRQKEGRRESLLDDGSGVKAPTPRRSTDRHELDSFIETLVGDRPGSRGPGTGSASPAGKKSRPNSTLGTVQVGSETYEQARGTATSAKYATASTQTSDEGSVRLDGLQTPVPQKPKLEVLTYSKAVQTAEEWPPQRRRRSSGGEPGSDVDGETIDTDSPSASKRLSRWQREREEELRQNLRREIEEELKAARDLSLDGQVLSAPSKFPARGLTNEELNAVTSSDDFLAFVERSSKVIEKALDQDYDVLADYALDGIEGVDEDEDEAYGTSRGKKGRRIRQVAQFYDERWSKKRMISDMGFSPKVSVCRLRVGNVHLTNDSFPNSFLLLTLRMHPHLRIHQALSKSGICIFIRALNIHSTAHPIFLPRDSRPFIPRLSLVVHTVARYCYGTPVHGHRSPYKKHH